MPFENCGAGMIRGVVIPWGRTVPAVAALVVCSHVRATLSRAALEDLLGKPCVYFRFDPADGPPIAQLNGLREGSRLDAGIQWGSGQPDSLFYLPTAQDG